MPVSIVRRFVLVLALASVASAAAAADLIVSA
jgi:hypothetical protein